MKTLEITSVAKLTTALLLGVALAGSPAMADRGGNGGNAGNGGGSSHAGGNGNGKGQGAEHSTAGKDKNTGDTDSDTDTDTDKPDDTSTTTVKTYGTINGFLHASANGIKHASSKSAVGSVRDAFLKATGEGTEFTQDSLVAALQPYSKKPITKETVLAINERLHGAGLISDDIYNAVLTGTP